MNEDSLHDDDDDDDVHIAQSDPFFFFITDSVFRLIKNESRDEIKLPFNTFLFWCNENWSSEYSYFSTTLH